MKVDELGLLDISPILHWKSNPVLNDLIDEVNAAERFSSCISCNKIKQGFSLLLYYRLADSTRTGYHCN